MRYLGNKESVINEIERLIIDKGLLSENTRNVFFDAFSGTAAVSNFFKDRFTIIANDYLYFSYIYTQGRLNNVINGFNRLDVDPFIFFNDDSINKRMHGFITENYSPAGKAGRMYFSIENAQKIDFIRFTIEEWKKNQKISDREYYYLIACLLESVSRVANVAGVYGSYLKKWDPRAIKNLILLPLECNGRLNGLCEVHNRKTEDIIEDINCDILYLDPPYTKNQYSIQYHVLETIARYDSPDVKGVTGGRGKKTISSNWSIPGKAEILLERVIAKTKAKHIILSYSADGIISRDFIESLLKRYCKYGSYDFRKFLYKKYRNHKTKNEEKHYEYLFYIEKKELCDVIYISPLNYIGGKGEIVHILKRYEPKKYNKFVDLFGGGFNVGINASCTNVIYNDYNFKVKQLIEMFKEEDTYEIYKYIIRNIKRYGLTKNGKEAYLTARKAYNLPEPPLRDRKLLYLLILYGFQQQIRFNSLLEFNNPVGESSFNEYIYEKMVSFSRAIKEKQVVFYSDDFEELERVMDANTFVYCDPPYLITLGSYNDGKRGFNGWSEHDERRLLRFLNRIHEKGVSFMLSNVLTHKGKTNNILLDWINDNNYQIFMIPQKSNKSRKEIIVINYSI